MKKELPLSAYCTTLEEARAVIDRQELKIAAMRARFADKVGKAARELTTHARDCTIYDSLSNDTPFDGICTCGFGLQVFRKGNGGFTEMLSIEVTKAYMEKLAQGVTDASGTTDQPQD